MPEQDNLTRSILKSAKSFAKVMPMMLGVILSMGLFQTYVTKEMLASLFSGNILADTLIGTVTGGISVGHPVTSYIIGGELIQNGISMYAVTAFLLSWVSLGIIQLPLEVQLFGKRFTLLRNLLSFAAAVIVSLLTVMTLEMFR